MQSAEACGFEGDLIKLLPLDDMPQDELTQFVRKLAEAHDQVKLLAKVTAALLRGAGKVLDDSKVNEALALLEPFKDEAADKARNAYEQAASNLRTQQESLERYHPVAALGDKGDFGEAFEWHALYDKCLTKHQDSFEYRFCAFDTFTQAGRSLGKYGGWVVNGDGRKQMAFEKGETCDGKPRSARVNFVCNSEDELVEVTEPAMCEYVATVGTPSACSIDAVRKMDADLAAVAEAAGLPYERDYAVKEILMP